MLWQDVSKSVLWHKQLQRSLFQEDEIPKMTPSTLTTAFKEYEVAQLSHDVKYNGTLYPKGTKGAIVHVHNNGEGYEFEVVTPKPNVLTLYPADLQK